MVSTATFTSSEQTRNFEFYHKLKYLYFAPQRSPNVNPLTKDVSEAVVFGADLSVLLAKSRMSWYCGRPWATPACPPAGPGGYAGPTPHAAASGQEACSTKLGS